MHEMSHRHEYSVHSIQLSTKTLVHDIKLVARPIADSAIFLSYLILRVLRWGQKIEMGMREGTRCFSFEEFGFLQLNSLAVVTIVFTDPS